MTTRITQIYKLPARQYRLILECGHKFTCSAHELMRDQLFPGKAVDCTECAGKTGPPLAPPPEGHK
jgi:hypothetical protein